MVKPQNQVMKRSSNTFYRDFDKRKIRFEKHRLIILFGPNYSAAKHMEESSRIYNHLRKLDGLNVDTGI